MMRRRVEPRAGPGPPLSPARRSHTPWRRDFPTWTGRRCRPRSSRSTTRSRRGAGGRKAGIPKEQLEALAEHRTSPLFSELERLVLAYADAMTTEVQVDGALVETLRRRLGPEALVQLTLTVAAANFTNRFNEALGTELEYEEIRHG